MANGDAGHLRDILAPVSLPGPGDVRLEPLMSDGTPPTEPQDWYRIEFEGNERRVFVVSQPAVPTLLVGIGNAEDPGLWTIGWVVTEVAHDGPNWVSGGHPGPRSSALAVAERAGFVGLL